MSHLRYRSLHATDGECFCGSIVDGSIQRNGSPFQTAEPCAELVFNFAGSQKLSQQILDGAPADVFASASGKNMDEVKINRAAFLRRFADLCP